MHDFSEGIFGLLRRESSSSISQKVVFQNSRYHYCRAVVREQDFSYTLKASRQDSVGWTRILFICSLRRFGQRSFDCKEQGPRVKRIDPVWSPLIHHSHHLTAMVSDCHSGVFLCILFFIDIQKELRGVPESQEWLLSFVSFRKTWALSSNSADAWLWPRSIPQPFIPSSIKGMIRLSKLWSWLSA